MKNTNYNGHYPVNEDLFRMLEKEADIDLENVAKNKEIIQLERKEQPNEKDFNHDKSGSDLDIPGSELDDFLENIGSEDEENNYYSLGGDAHSDLDED